MTRHVLIRAELLDGLDVDGNAMVMIPYSPESVAPHGRVRFVDPAAIVHDLRELGDVVLMVDRGTGPRRTIAPEYAVEAGGCAPPIIVGAP